MSVITEEPAERVDRYDFGVQDPPTARAVVAIAIAAGLFDAFGFRGAATLSASLLLVSLAGGAVLVPRTSTAPARVFAGFAFAFAFVLTVRASPWVVLPCFLASFGCSVLAASFVRGGRIADLTVPRLALRAAHALVHAVLAPGYLMEAIPRPAGVGDRWAPIVRGLLIASPLALVLGLLLASADAVFASFFRLPDLGSALTHGILAVLGALLCAALLRIASAAPVPAVGGPPRILGATEALTVLAAMVTLYAAFGVSQVITLAGGARHVLETRGLTYAEYARSGFFQLLAVATITLVVLLSLRTVVDVGNERARRRLVLLGEIAVVLTIVIVVVAIRRLALYDDAFGLTMLRLASSVFAWWLGAVFIAVGMYLCGRLSSVLPAAMAIAAVTLLGWAAANPESYVVRHNLSRGGERLDLAYLAGLSEDAVTPLIERAPDAAEVQRRACDLTADNQRDVLAFNLSHSRAFQVAASACKAHVMGAAIQSGEVSPGS